MIEEDQNLASTLTQMQCTQEILIYISIMWNEDFISGFSQFQGTPIYQGRVMRLTKQLCGSVTTWSPAVTVDFQVY